MQEYEKHTYKSTAEELNSEFKKNFEPYSAPYEKRIESLYKLHKAGLKTWVSIEPYPTPNLDKSSPNIEALLEKIVFVNKIIFGTSEILLNFCMSKGEGRYSKLRSNFSLYSFCVAFESVVSLSGQFKTCDSAIFAIEDIDFECKVSTCSLNTP